MKKNSKKSQENEYKWQVQSLNDFYSLLQFAKNLGANVSKSNTIQIKDQYLDTAERYFQNCDLTCRIRYKNKHYELTFKSYSNPKQELFIRDEKTVQFPSFTSMKAAVRYCRINFFKNIQPLFEILNNRQMHLITLPCGSCLEASFDHVLMIRGKKKHPMQEIELELKSGDFEKFKQFAEKLSLLFLKPSRFSKFEVGMKHLLKETSCYSLEKLSQFANDILKKNIKQLKKFEKDVFVIDNPEIIHDMRVTLRKLRLAIKIFKKILPGQRTSRIQKKLQNLGRVLGEKRDIDVFFNFISHIAGKKKPMLFLKIAKKKRAAKKRIFFTLQLKKYQNLMKSLHDLKVVKNKGNIFKISRKLIKKALDRVLEAASKLNEDLALHQLRISIKKLRYVCEFFEPIFKRYICSLVSFIEKTKKIQKLLGEHQDSIKGISTLIQFKEMFSFEEFQRIKEIYESKKKETRILFFHHWKDFWVGTGFRKSHPTTALELILM